MNFYIDVKIKSHPKMSAKVLFNKLYLKFHDRLYDMEANDIGASFPKIPLPGILLGNVLRIHGTKERLGELQSEPWLKWVVDYCFVTKIKRVPAMVQYRNVSRLQTSLSHAKLRRLMKRRPISSEGVRAYKAKMFASGLRHPYVELRSGSTDQRYRQYIHMGELLDKPVAGIFNYFGLSKTATIPWF